MGLKIYHNPKCSKSRRALALIQERGIEPEIVEYLQKPFKPSELRETLAKLALRPRDILRQKEAKEEGFADDLAAGLSDRIGLNLLISNEILNIKLRSMLNA